MWVFANISQGNIAENQDLNIIYYLQIRLQSWIAIVANTLKNKKILTAKPLDIANNNNLCKSC